MHCRLRSLCQLRRLSSLTRISKFPTCSQIRVFKRPIWKRFKIIRVRFPGTLINISVFRQVLSCTSRLPNVLQLAFDKCYRASAAFRTYSSWSYDRRCRTSASTALTASTVSTTSPASTASTTSTESTVFITSTATTSLKIYYVWANKRPIRTDDVLELYSATGAGARTAAAGATDRQTTCRSCTLPFLLALHARLQLSPHLKVFKTWICEHDFAQNGPPSALDASTTAGPNHATVTAARRSISHVEPNRLSHTTETSTQTRHTNGP